MKFNFKETIALAGKGFKPGDILELSELDGDKFDKDDILSLVSSGYNKEDIKKLVDTFKEQAADDTPQDDDHNDTEGNKPEGNTPAGDTSDQDDNIDYKELYEKEKKLREKLQHRNVNNLEGADADDMMSDYDLAISVANKILGG